MLISTISPAALVAAFADHDVTLPFKVHPECTGVIFDDKGRDVATVDSNAARPDPQAHAITVLIASAVNHLARLDAGATGDHPNLAQVSRLLEEIEGARMLTTPAARKFSRGDRVRKRSGSSWQGRIVGGYGTDLTPIGYAVESEREAGSVQIYPQDALELVARAGVEGEGI